MTKREPHKLGDYIFKQRRRHPETEIPFVRRKVSLFWLIHLFSYQLGYNSAGNKHHANNSDDYYALSGHLCR
jgi:hypothetical protein